MTVRLACAHCGGTIERAEWEVRRSKTGRFFCDTECHNAWQRANPTTGEESAKWRRIDCECAECGKSITRPPSLIPKSGRVFCSVNCHNVWQRGRPLKEESVHWQGGPVVVSCSQCGSRLTRCRGDYNRYSRHFCGQECKAKWRSKHESGPRSPLWRGGGRRPRHETRLWARAVKRNAEFRCEVCGGTKDLCAHHRKPYAEYPELREDVGNGVCLCGQCHGAIHWGRTFIEQFITA